jgi:hypothetical protein
MAYTPGTDFVAMWRNQVNGALKAEMPALDFMIATLARAGMINVSFAATHPTTNQPRTVWFRPANPTHIGEGVVLLWDAAAQAYVNATPRLFNAYLRASED